MKRALFTLLLCGIALLLCACGSSDNAAVSAVTPAPTVDNTALPEAMAAPVSTEAATVMPENTAAATDIPSAETANTSATAPRDAAAAEPGRIDIDLSNMSGTVVYSQVYNIVSDPDTFIGQTIRMAGLYSVYEDAERGVVYHACVIPDATACCAQGIEFVWKGDHAWPADYPDAGADILVTGRLESYFEDGYMYLHLVDADLAVG